MPAGSQHCGMIPIQSVFPLLLELVLLVWWFFAIPVFFDVFVFLQVPVFLVSQWCVFSNSLVGQRWCLTSCSVIFVWLQFYMRSSACWIATLWHDTHSVWFSIHFWAHLLISLKLCRFSFIWQFVFSCLRVLGITVVYLFENLGWSSLMFDMMFGNFRLTAVLHAVICLLDRNTVAWYPFSLIFLCF